MAAEVKRVILRVAELTKLVSHGFLSIIPLRGLHFLQSGTKLTGGSHITVWRKMGKHHIA